MVELAIVLVILGLLVGGILSGQSLIRASENRAAIRDLTNYTTTLYSFREKYFYFPGDMPNASQFWGADSNCPGDSAHPSTGAATCNGNGNGKIESNQIEIFRAWQQLANAGLISGSYVGVNGPNSPFQAIVGWNVPAGKRSNTGFGLEWNDYTNDGPGGGDFAWEGNRLWYGQQVSNNQPLGPALTPQETWNIDLKIDDGRPGLGRVMTWRFSPECTTTDASLTAKADSAQAVYRLDNTQFACAIFVILK